MEVIGLLLVIAAIGGGAAFAGHVIKAARSTLDASKPPRKGAKVKDGRPWLARLVMPRQVAPAGKAAKPKTAGNAPINPDVGKRKPADARSVWKPARLPKARAAAARLVPGERRASAEPAQPAAANGKPPAPATVPRTPWPGPPSRTARRPAQPPTTAPDASPASPNGGPVMTTPAPAAAPARSGGAAADFFSVIHRFVVGALSGGLRSKSHMAAMVGEGLGHQAAEVQRYGDSLRDTSQYPARVWEPVLQAAAQMRAAQMRLAEHVSALAGIAATPAGELVGQAPHRDELHNH